MSNETSSCSSTGVVFGAVGGAIASSICCIVPLVALVLGTGSAWISRVSFMEPYRPVLLLITFAMLTLAFVRVYRRAVPPCGASACRRSRAVLWATSAVVGGVVLAPYFVPRLLAAAGPTDPKSSGAQAADECCPPVASDSATAAPRPALTQRAMPIDPSKEIVFKVSKLGCPLISGVGCGHLLAPLLAQIDGIDGVMRSYTNWTGSELRVTIAPKGDLNAVAAKVRAFLAEDGQAPVQVEADALAKALKDQEWRSVEHVVELTTYEFHTFARQQLGAYADEQKFDVSKKQKLLGLVDQVWAQAAQGLADPRPEAEAYATYWHTRLERLVQIFEQEAKTVLSPEQVEEIVTRYSRRTK